MRHQLVEALVFLDFSINTIIANAIREGINPYEARDVHGRYILLDALTSKVNALSALAVNDARSS